jgi:threonine/homoserine/homoserine lactone efflux protein
MQILAGFVIGIVYVAAPGPVTVETLRHGIKGGLIDALAVQTGASIGVIAYALLALFGAGLLLQEATWQLVTGALGMTVLIYLGIRMIRDEHALLSDGGSYELGGDSARRAFWAGSVLSLANPLDILFWLSIGNRVLHDPGLDAPAFLGGVFAGGMVTSLALALLAGFWRGRLPARAVPLISWTCGLACIGFGLELGFSIGRQLTIW